MPLTRVQAGLIEATGTPDATTFLRGDGAWNAPVVAALSTASGSAPSYSARAWVNFNGTGTVAIRASGNVTSITDNGTGDYTINFTTAMSDINYSLIVSSSPYYGVQQNYGISLFYNQAGAAEVAPTTSAARFSIPNIAGGGADCKYVCASIFR